MSVIAEFEEKEFESAFNRQLSVIDNFFWTPGQVFEGAIGFDGAALIDDNGTPFAARPGIVLDINFVQKVFSLNDERFPPFKFNFFAQHKRPEYVYGIKTDHWHYWNRPYFRYEINNDQQNTLHRLELACNELALVLYCSPCFYTKADLWKHISGNSIIQNTNFIQPSDLQSHRHYTYISPGGYGIAHSEPKEVYGQSLYENIKLYAAKSKNQKPSELVINAGDILYDTFNSPKKSYSLENMIVKQLCGEKGANVPLVNSMAHILALQFVYGIYLTLIGEHKKW